MTIAPKGGGTRRSGQGVAVPPANTPRKTFYRQDAFATNRSGSPTAPRDTDAAMPRLYSKDETYQGGDDTIDLPGEEEQNQNLPPQKNSSAMSMGPSSRNVAEHLLRQSIRMILHENMSEDELDKDSIEEFSCVSAVAGNTLPIGMSNPKQKKLKKKK